MPRAAITRSALAAVALTLLLATSAAAAPRALRATGTPAAEHGLAAQLSAAWQWWSGLWSSRLTNARGQEGSAVDPNGLTGKPALAGLVTGYAIASGDQGSGVDPNGSR